MPFILIHIWQPKMLNLFSTSPPLFSRQQCALSIHQAQANVTRQPGRSTPYSAKAEIDSSESERRGYKTGIRKRLSTVRRETEEGRKIWVVRGAVQGCIKEIEMRRSVERVINKKLIEE